MTLSHRQLKHWPMAALALAISCTVSAQTTTGTTGTGATAPGTTAAGPTEMPNQTQGAGSLGTTSTTSTSGTTGTTGATGTGTMSGTAGTTGTTGTTGTAGTSGSMDTTTGITGSTTGTASSYQSNTTSGSMMGRPMYSQGAGNYSLIPYSTGGYVGVNIGKPDFDTPCVAGFSCSNNTTAYKLYTGGMFNEYVGAELGYVNMGRAKRADGRTEAHGINLSLVGRVPLGGFNVFGKVGTTYGRTKTSASTAAVAAGATTGKGSGWGGSYGVGVGFDLTQASAIVLEWERHDFRFAGRGKQAIDTTMLGYVHRF